MEKKKPAQEHIYLELPNLNHKEFLKLAEELKEKGARYDEKVKKWHIRPSLKDQFLDYLPVPGEKKFPKIPKGPNEKSLYLNFPKNEGFEKTRKYFRENGAEFDWKKRQWYIQPELKEQFKDYLPNYQTYEIRPDDHAEKEKNSNVSKSYNDHAESIGKRKPQTPKRPNEKSLYLNFPKNEGFEKTRKYFRENGAEFDPEKRKWYIQRELKEQFKDYLDYSYDYDIKDLYIMRPDNYAGKELDINDPEVYIYDMKSAKFVDKKQIKNDPDFIEYFNKEKEALKAKEQETSDVKGQEASTDGKQTVNIPDAEVMYQEIKADIESHKYQATPDIVNKFVKLNHLTGKKMDFNQFYRAFKEGVYKGAAGQLIRELGEEFYKQRQPQRRTPISRAIAACNQVPVR